MYPDGIVLLLRMSFRPVLIFLSSFVSSVLVLLFVVVFFDDVFQETHFAVGV